MFGLAKLAASFDARRNKQYWQLLKRLYGGNDEAVAALQQTRDPGIYHGTKDHNLADIMQHGLVNGGRDTSGKNGMNHAGFNDFGVQGGIFFGDRTNALRYTSYDHGYHPDGVLRLALPSELKGTKTMYPPVTHAQTTSLEGPSMELDDGRDLSFLDRLRMRAKQEFENRPDMREYRRQRLQEMGDDATAHQTVHREIRSMFPEPFRSPEHAQRVRVYGRAGSGEPSVSDWDGKQFHYTVPNIPPDILRKG